jgi:hypothetical protein
MSGVGALTRLRALKRKADRRALEELDVSVAAVTAPSAEAWDRLCAIANRFGKAAHEPLLEYLSEVLAAWPDDLRVMPDSWWNAWTKKKHPLARLARLRLLDRAGAWYDGNLSGDGGSVLSVWGAPGGGAYVQGTAMDPHRAGGELVMMTGEGRTKMTLVQSSADYGQAVGARFSDDGKRLVTVYAAERLLVALWETRTGKSLASCEIGPDDAVLQDSQALVAIDAKVSRVAVHHRALGAVHLVTGKGKLAGVLPGGKEIDAISFIGDGKRLATTCGKTLTLWDVATRKPAQKIALPVAALEIATAGKGALDCIGASGRCVLRAGKKGLEVDPASVRRWPTTAGAARAALHPELGAILSLAGRPGLALPERRETRRLAGEHIWLEPAPGGREWIAIALVPGAAAGNDENDPQDDEEVGDGDKNASLRAERDPDGGIYLWSPDGNWSLPAGSLRIARNPLDDACSKYTSPSELLDHEKRNRELVTLVSYAVESGTFPLDVEERATWSDLHYPLHNAAELCSAAQDGADPIWAVFDLLLARDPDPKRVDSEGRNALHGLFYKLNGCAWYDGPPRGRLEDVVLKLLAAGCDPWAVAKSAVIYNPEEEVSARCLARLGLRNCVAALAEVRPALVQDAALHGQWEVVDDVLARGVGIDGRGPDGNTALHWTAFEEDAQLTRELLRRGADPNLAIDEREPVYLGFTPLHLAAFRDHADVARALVEGGARVDARDARGWTAAHLAAEWGHVATLQVLVSADAALDAETNDGETVIDLVRDPARSLTYPKSGEYGDWSNARRLTRDWIERVLESGASSGRGARFGASARCSAAIAARHFSTLRSRADAPGGGRASLP